MTSNDWVLPTPSVTRAMLAVMRRDLLLAYRSRTELLNPLVFFLIAVAMIPLGIGPDPSLLAMISGGVIWVMALLASLLSIDGLFKADFEDGTLEQLVIGPHPLFLLVLVKVLVHWLVAGLPLALLSPLLGLWLNLPSVGYVPLFGSLLLGTALLSLFGAIGAALTVSLRKGGLLISLIIMPLYIPVLILGTGVVTNAIDGFPFGALMTIMAGLLAGAIALAPLATASALKISLSA